MKTTVYPSADIAQRQLSKELSVGNIVIVYALHTKVDTFAGGTGCCWRAPPRGRKASDVSSFWCLRVERLSSILQRNCLTLGKGLPMTARKKARASTSQITP